VLRPVLWFAAVVVCTLPALADQAVTPNETLVRLSVQPAAEPKPALRYLLLPELREMSPGNPIPTYLRCLLDLNPQPNREVIGRAALKEADRAARLDKPDWQILTRAKMDGINLLLPDVQRIRALAQALRDRFREEVAVGRLDDALVTAKTLFAISRHLSEHPTVIGDLVGIAIANVAIGPLEELLEQPGSPNLYWALTNLPDPLVPMDRGLEGERMLIQVELRDLSDAAAMTAGQIRKLTDHLDQIRATEPLPAGAKTVRAFLDARLADKDVLPAARRRLAEAGLPEERLRTFPANQVILLDEKLEYEIRRDALMKFHALPPWQAEAELAKVKPDPRPTLFQFFLPALEKVRRAQTRLSQRVALLRHVEALRMYAAGHDGKLPATLADVPVPLPVDPVTGKPVNYWLDGATAHLRGAAPPGEEANPAFNVHYEITIRK
jgi:hypothetical protein